MNTELRNRFAAMSAALLILLTAISLRAGTITVVDLPATGTDAASGISTANTYLDAWDFGNGAASSVNINGVSFTHFNPGIRLTSTTNVTDANFGGTLTLSAGGPNNNNLLQPGSSSGQGNLAGQVESGSGMFTLLTDMVYLNNANTNGIFTEEDYGGLTVGNQYSLRIYYRLWSSNRGSDVTFNGEGFDQTYSGNPLDEDAGGAHYIEYDFTASSTHVTAVTTDNDISPDGVQPWLLYGATLQVVPEPTVASVLTMGGVLLGLTGHRLKKWRFRSAPASSPSRSTVAPVIGRRLNQRENQIRINQTQA